MIVNREKFQAELSAAGCVVRGLCDDGRLVLADGTIVDGDGVESHEVAGAKVDEDALRAVLRVRAHHDPAPTEAQALRADERSLGGIMGCLALVLVHGDDAPAAAKRVVRAAAAKAVGG